MGKQHQSSPFVTSMHHHPTIHHQPEVKLTSPTNRESAMSERKTFRHQISSRDHPVIFRVTSGGSGGGLDINESQSSQQNGKGKKSKSNQTHDSSNSQQQDQQKKDGEDDKIFATFTEVNAKKVVKVTERLINAELAQSTLLAPPRPLTKTPAFSLEDDIIRGDLVGTGGFASIYSVNFTDPSVKQSFSTYQADDATEQEYVIKHLSADSIEPLGRMCANALDIVLEANFLAAMDHPNILKLEGCSEGGLAAYSDTLQTDGFFMILPKLTCTLPDKMKLWQKQQPKKTHHAPNFMDLSMLICGFSSTQQLLLEGGDSGGPRFIEKIQIVIDLLKALEYLHGKRVMHRDIKPANVGFDQLGCLKLFDFGLAKEIPAGSDTYNDPKNAQPDDVWTPGAVGTMRYISPEIFLKDPIDCKTDVYSTAILCWEVLTLHKAYEDTIQGRYFTQCVAIYGERPDIPKKWPRALRRLMENCWTGRVKTRFTSNEMRTSLEKIVLQLQHSV